MTASEASVDTVAWYHTIDLPGRGPTPGFYDLRGVVGEVLPADLAGLRCLDACSATGFWAFEMEKRGAREVVALDVATYRDKDWRRPWVAPAQEEAQGQTFRIAKDLLSSRVERVERSVYDVTPDFLGSFDLVFIGSVLLHLQDPVRALRALHAVTTDRLISFEPILPVSSLVHRRTPQGRMAAGDDARWWTPNAAAHRAWVSAAGFDVIETSRHRQPYGRLHPRFPRQLPRTPHAVGFWLAGRHLGVLSQRILARPLPVDLP